MERSAIYFLNEKRRNLPPLRKGVFVYADCAKKYKKLLTPLDKLRKICYTVFIKSVGIEIERSAHLIFEREEVELTSS